MRQAHSPLPRLALLGAAGGNPTNAKGGADSMSVRAPFGAQCPAVSPWA